MRKEESVPLNLTVDEGIEVNDNIEVENEDKITKEDFAFYLMNMREYLGMTRKDFADLLTIPQTSYYTYEQGKSLPSNWIKIKERVKVLIKAKSNKIKEKEDFKTLLNYSLERSILCLHHEGKNTVQIGVLLSLEEGIVENFLKSQKLKPLIYKLYD